MHGQTLIAIFWVVSLVPRDVVSNQWRHQWRAAMKAAILDDPTRNRWLVFTLCHCTVTISAVFSFNEPSVSTSLSNVASCLTAFSIWKVILSALCHWRRMHNEDGFYFYFPLLLLPEHKWRKSTKRETRWRRSKLDLMRIFQDFSRFGFGFRLLDGSAITHVQVNTNLRRFKINVFNGE